MKESSPEKKNEGESIDQERLKELNNLIAFIEKYADVQDFFDQNGSRDLYEKFRDPDSRERTLHTIVHFFISLHLPQPVVARRPFSTEQVPAPKKSNLKQKEHYTSELKQASEQREKRGQNSSARPRTKDELNKLFAWWENEMKPDSDNKSDISDAELVKMAFGEERDVLLQTKDAMQKTARGYLKGVTKTTSQLAGKKACPEVQKNEYAFFQKKVRLNTVEKKVHTFQLDQEEIDGKKQTKKSTISL